jgi:sulfur-oxidizing protein SoxY
MERREFIKTGGAAGIFGLFVAAGLVKPAPAFAQSSGWNAAAFSTKTIDDTYKAMGAQSVVPTKEVSWGATPEIAENGAVVPVALTSNLPNTESIAFLIEKNPNTLSARFDFPRGTEPSISTRVKMGQTSDVFALIKADGKYYVAKREIKVTLGGCGG